MNATAYGKAMAAREAARFILDRKPLFILDVRNEDDYANWKMEGVSVTSANIPYFELLDGVDAALARMPEQGPVLVACAKEGSSRYVADRLAEATGRDDIHYLEGGMQAWSEYAEPVKVGDLRGDGALYQFVRIGKGCLSYMIMSGGEAAVVDPLRLTGIYADLARELGVRIAHAIDTHLHADHISGGRKLAEEAGGTYWLPPKDAEEVVFDYAKLEDGGEIAVGSTTIRIQAVHSPGHTIGSTSLIVDGRYLLTGDILFVESIGRPDLAGRAEDWAGDLRETLYGRFKALPAELLVLPAHFGKPTELGDGGKVGARLGELYERNPGLKIGDEGEFRRTVTGNLPPQPNAYQDIRQTNMGNLNPPDERQREMDAGPNRCAVHDN